VGESPTLDVEFIMRRNQLAGQWFVVRIFNNAAGMPGLQGAFRQSVGLLRNEAKALGRKARAEAC
jgi:hypothetical protein